MNFCFGLYIFNGALYLIKKFEYPNFKERYFQIYKKKEQKFSSILLMKFKYHCLNYYQFHPIINKFNFTFIISIWLNHLILFFCHLILKMPKDWDLFYFNLLNFEYFYLYIQLLFLIKFIIERHDGFVGHTDHLKKKISRICSGSRKS